MIKKTALALASLVAGVSAQAQTAEASALSVTVDVTYVSSYVFRGVKLADDSIQPSVEAAYGDFYAGVWYSDDIGTSATVSSETDVYAGYGFAVTDIIKLDGGVTRYLYDGESGADSTEVYIGATVDVLLSPSLYVYYDFDYENITVEASVGYSIPVDAINASIDLSGKVGYVDLDTAIGGEDSYTYFVAGVSVPYKLSDAATLTVGVDYIYNTEENVGTVASADDDTFVGKVGISIGF